MKLMSGMRGVAGVGLAVALALTSSPVVATAASPTLGSAAARTVVAAPVITAQPASLRVLVQTTVLFSVSARGTDLTYIWQRRVAGQNWLNVSSGTGSSIRVVALPGVNLAGYRVVVGSLGTQTISNTATLTVVTPIPRISANPASVHVVSGDLVTYSVTASGYALSYLWQAKLPGKNWTYVVGATKSSYRLYATVARQVYQYRVVISNPGGRAISAAAGLAVDSTRSDPYRTLTATNLTNWRVMTTRNNNDAWPQIQALKLGSAPAAGYRYVAVWVDVRYLGTGAGHPYYVDVSFVGGDGRTYTDTNKVDWSNNIYSLNDLYYNAIGQFASIVEVPATAVAAGRWLIDDISDYPFRTAWFALS